MFLQISLLAIPQISYGSLQNHHSSCALMMPSYSHQVLCLVHLCIIRHTWRNLSYRLASPMMISTQLSLMQETSLEFLAEKRISVWWMWVREGNFSYHFTAFIIRLVIWAEYCLRHQEIWPSSIPYPRMPYPKGSPWLTHLSLLLDPIVRASWRHLNAKWTGT